MNTNRKDGRRSPLLACPVLLIGLVQALPAQTFHVSPAAYATVESPCLTLRPFGHHLQPVWRHLQIHGDLPGQAGTITGLAWRRDGQMYNNFAAFRFSARLLLSTAAVAPGGIKADFAGNHGPDLRVVVSGSGGVGSYLKISWPATSPPSSPPAPFAYTLPFTNPFLFTGSPVCWELLIVDRDTNVTGQFELACHKAVDQAGWSHKPTRLDLTDLGVGCRATGRKEVAYTSCRYDKQGTTWTVRPRATNMPFIFAAIWFLGTSTTRWGSLNLPYTVPGGPCQLYTDPVVTGMVGGNVTGILEGPPLQVVETPLLWGVEVHCQWLGFDPGLPMNALLTRAQTWRFPGGGLTMPAKAEYCEPGYGLVTRFTFR